MRMKLREFEIDEILKSMVIYVDTREHESQIFKFRTSQFKCTWNRHKLNFGDYSCQVTVRGEVHDLSGTVCVERKQSADELCQCFGRERARFTREFERAKDAGARVYLLIEDTSMSDLYNEKYRSKLPAKSLIPSILAWIPRYNMVPVFCTEKESGIMIYDILFREAKEYLRNLEIEVKEDGERLDKTS